MRLRRTPPDIARVEIINLQPGDQLALIYDRPLTADQALSIKAQAEARWPGHQVSVLDSNPTLKVIRRSETA